MICLKKNPLKIKGFFLIFSKNMNRGISMKSLIYLNVMLFLLIGCGSGSNNTVTTPPITGLEGDIGAIEPLNID